MPDDEVVAAISTAFQAFNERRFADFARYVTDDVVEVYPQSGERIEGSDRQLAFHEAFPRPADVHGSQRPPVGRPRCRRG
ncbi:MAG: hypothetical protein M3R49_05170 [Chloroflexota bacterium]|nr:hypothetical protein [Chloroflexota bacterium]